jgi:hypothetical protein
MGTELTIPCPPDGRPLVAEATPLRDAGAELTLVTGSNYAPFTDQNWLGKGMLTEIVNAAMERMPDPVSYAIRWNNDWSQHLFPILDKKVADMGFPWIKPDCAQDPDNVRCVNFHFPDPLVEILSCSSSTATGRFPSQATSTLRARVCAGLRATSPMVLIAPTGFGWPTVWSRCFSPRAPRPVSSCSRRVRWMPSPSMNSLA